MNIADPFTMLSEIFDMLGEDDLTCNECKRQWRISHGCTIQWEDQGVEWVDFELSCDCDIEDTAPYPCIRYDGETVEFFMRTLPVENVTKCIKRENPNTDVDTKVWHRIGQHIGIPHNEYWHWSKEWHESAERLKQKLDAGICPDCEGVLRMIGDDWFCLDCDFDTLIPIEKQVANSQQN